MSRAPRRQFVPQSALPLSRLLLSSPSTLRGPAPKPIHPPANSDPLPRTPGTSRIGGTVPEATALSIAETTSACAPSLDPRKQIRRLPWGRVQFYRTPDGLPEESPESSAPLQLIYLLPRAC